MQETLILQGFHKLEKIGGSAFADSGRRGRVFESRHSDVWLKGRNPCKLEDSGFFFTLRFVAFSTKTAPFHSRSNTYSNTYALLFFSMPVNRSDRSTSLS